MHVYAPLSDLEIAAAVPQGSRWTRSQKKLLRAFLGWPELAQLYRDGATVKEIWRFLVRWAYRGDGTSMPVRARLCAELGIGETTWKRWRRFLERHGWLGTVRQGYTPALRAASLVDEEPNEAAVYVLCIPAAAAREKRRTRPPVTGETESGPLRRPPAVTSSSYGSSWAPTARRRAPLRADLVPFASVLRRGPVKTLSERWCAWLARPWIRAGWLPADVAAAVEHHPVDGRYGGRWDDVGKPGPLLAWRLSRWLSDPEQAWQHWRAHGRWPGGVAPIASPSRRSWRDVKPIGQVYVDRNRAQAAAAAAPDAAAAAASIRAQLGWRQPKEAT